MHRYYPDSGQDYNTGRLVGDIISVVAGLFEIVGSAALIGVMWGGIDLGEVPSVGTISFVIPAAVAATGGLAVAIGHGVGIFYSSGQKLSGDFNKINSKNQSEIWKKFDNVKGSDRNTSGIGRDKKYYEWDYTHNDIEVYDRNGKHLGSMDPNTGKMYKPPVTGRKIKP